VDATPNQRLTSSFGIHMDPKRRSQPEWVVREATLDDVPAVAVAVAELLVELSGGGPAPAALESAVAELVRDREAGALLVAEAGGEDEDGGPLVGVLAASWQLAIHVPGRYGTIQDLWVHPDWRSRAVGHELVEAYCELVRAVGAKRVEVGLPRESFERIGATTAFYQANGFEHLGPRMRRKL